MGVRISFCVISTRIVDFFVLVVGDMAVIIQLTFVIGV